MKKRDERERPVVLRGGKVVDAARRKAVAADVLVVGDTIREVGRPGMKVPETARVVDASRKLLHPGLINAHTHSHGNLAKGMGDRWTLELLLTAGPMTTGHRGVEEKYLGTLIGAVEMAMKGVTACYDLTVEFPTPSVEGLEAAARAYEDVGLRAVVAPMVADLTFFEAIPGLMEALPAPLRKEVERMKLAPSSATLANIRKALRGWKHDPDRVRLAVAPTIPHHCTDGFLRGCGALAREFGVGLHTHVAESKVQVVAGFKRYGSTLTAHLDRLGIVGPDFTVAHGVWLDDDDMKRLGDKGASVAHNPAANLRLGSGMADMRRMLERGINVGIGTDGASCSDNQNMYEAMRAASAVSMVRGPDWNKAVTSQEVLSAATAGSARALGFGDRLGRIEAGCKADIVFLELDHINWIPMNDAVNALVHVEDGLAVHSVMVGGRMVVEDRKPVNVDLARLARQAEAAREKLARLNRANRELYRRLEPVVGGFCPGLARTPLHVNRYGAPPLSPQ